MPTTAASWSSMLIHSWSGVNMVVKGALLGGASAAAVAGGGRRQRADAHRVSLGAHLGVDLVVSSAMVGRQVGHRDRLVDAGSDGAAGHVAELVAVRVVDRRAFAHRNALQADQADALDRRARRQLRL